MSEEMKSYSPGPWSRRFNGASVIIDDANGKAVARAMPRIFGELNGDLISAAPELLRCMESAVVLLEVHQSVNGLHGDPYTCEKLALWRGVVAKAKGGTK